LFEADLTGHNAREVLQRHLAERRFSPDLEEFAWHLLNGVQEHEQEIDALIVEAAPNWPLEQMARVDVNILRIAILELLFSAEADVPAKVAINEAVELSKTFGSEGSRRFVNGVLGTLARQNNLPGTQPRGKKRTER